MRSPMSSFCPGVRGVEGGEDVPSKTPHVQESAKRRIHIAFGNKSLLHDNNLERVVLYKSREKESQTRRKKKKNQT